MLLQKAASFAAMFARAGKEWDAALWREEIGSLEVRVWTTLLRGQFPAALLAVVAYDLCGGELRQWRSKNATGTFGRKPASPGHILKMSRRMVAYWRAHSEQPLAEQYIMATAEVFPFFPGKLYDKRMAKSSQLPFDMALLLINSRRRIFAPRQVP